MPSTAHPEPVGAPVLDSAPMSEPTRPRSPGSGPASGAGGAFGGVSTWARRWGTSLRHNLPYWPIMVWNLTLFALLRPRRWFTTDDFPGTEALAAEWKRVRDEAEDLLAGAPLPGFEEIDPGQVRLNTDARWKTFVLTFGGHDVDANRARCPATAALLDDVPGVYTAMFSVFEPGKRLDLHAGALKGIVRLLLPVVVPGGGPCLLEIGGSSRRLQEGELLLFDDTYPHRAANLGDGPRVALFCDLVRPMPWPWLDRANRAVLRRLGTSRRMRRAVERAERPRPLR